MRVGHLRQRVIVLVELPELVPVPVRVLVQEVILLDVSHPPNLMKQTHLEDRRCRELVVQGVVDPTHGGRDPQRDVNESTWVASRVLSLDGEWTDRQPLTEKVDQGVETWVRESLAE